MVNAHHYLHSERYGEGRLYLRKPQNLNNEVEDLKQITIKDSIENTCDYKQYTTNNTSKRDESNQNQQISLSDQSSKYSFSSFIDRLSSVRCKTEFEELCYVCKSFRQSDGDLSTCFEC